MSSVAGDLFRTWHHIKHQQNLLYRCYTYSIDSFDLALLKIILLNNFRYLSITPNNEKNLIITSNPKTIKLKLIKEYSVH